MTAHEERALASRRGRPDIYRNRARALARFPWRGRLTSGPPELPHQRLRQSEPGTMNPYQKEQRLHDLRQGARRQLKFFRERARRVWRDQRDGRSGPAGPCKRPDPVIGIVAPTDARELIVAPPAAGRQSPGSWLGFKPWFRKPRRADYPPIARCLGDQ
jgi:hypothetical protein